MLHANYISIKLGEKWGPGNANLNYNEVLVHAYGMTIIKPKQTKPKNMENNKCW